MIASNSNLVGLNVDQDYLGDLDHIINEGCMKPSRAGDTVSEFGLVSTYSLHNDAIPLLVSKEIPLSSMIHEIVWFLSGETSLKYLHEHNVHIWDAWAIDGDLPNIYQKQWFKWEDTKYASLEEIEKYVDKGYVKVGDAVIDDTPKFVMRKVYDQFERLITTLRTAPNDRRLIVSAWNVGDLDFMALPPCHRNLTFYTLPADNNYRMQLAGNNPRYLAGTAFAGYSHDQLLDLFDNEEDQAKFLADYNIPEYVISSQLDLRSSDRTLGYPWNIAQYAIFTHIVARMANMATDKMMVVATDAHVYLNHLQGEGEEGISPVEQHMNQWNGLVQDIENSGEYTVEIDGVKNPEGDEVVSHARLVLSDKVAKLGANKLSEITFDDIQITNYKALPKVKFPKASV